MVSFCDSIYGTRTSGIAHGDVFTSPDVVCFILDQVGYISDKNLQDISILEPSCGNGEFIYEIAKRLLVSANKFGFNANSSFISNVYAYDIDEEKIEVCRRRVNSLGYQNTSNIQLADFLRINTNKVDIVVGNPPYIRYENIPFDILDYCKSTFSLFHYRSDLYIPFFEKTLSLLKPGGKHGFICSNRWLKSEYGKKLRRHISTFYNLQILVDLEQANAFQQDVLAYPAITVISAENKKEMFLFSEAKDISELKSLSFSRKKSPSGEDWTTIFTGVASNKKLLQIERQGFNIGIGVATGADAVFVSDNLVNLVEQDLIIPAIGAKDLRGNRLKWSGKYILNPYTKEGDLIDLIQYPKAKQYLEKYKEKLSSRHIAIKKPTQWYRTIDRIVPRLQKQAKILLPDMSGNSYIFVDDGEFYPLHNIYYITGDSNIKLYILAAILMSDFAKNQLAAITNKMNGGFLRWQSQYLKKIYLPDIMQIQEEDLQILLDCYNKYDIAGINIIVNKQLETVDI